MIRKPAVAGQFYEGNKASLTRSIEKSFLHKLGPGKLPSQVEQKNEKKIVSVIAPHAGYIYSGPVAAHSYLELWKDRKDGPDTVIIIGPNHHGGAPIATMNRGQWETPLGKVDIDEDIANSIINRGKNIQDDPYSHRSEHSIEVQLPFLQYLYKGNFKFVPICMLYHDYQNCEIVGEAVASTIKSSEKDIIIVASTDFTHFEPHEVAKNKDRKAISAIEKLDARLLFNTVRQERITMCGVDPVTSTIIASKKLGAEKARFLKWSSSGDIISDKSRVVGYGSIVIMK
ncbi:MAG: AmmeMemoRadiSam system protein B [Promethearchaeota archaeon]|nr:MAG: AmmeMemoRadiSam system protein B [Candidatus Lokiarchaeota archaeon]